ncbi:MAG: Regulatory protein [Rhodospirillaceae bacterium]|nr:MAG: Regulatory protein [Rhodospirillaceae bacterium]TNC94237.1 MAG: Regulatory protein, TetR [Stygiobacter sp.]
MNKPLTPRSAAKRAAMLDAAQVCFLDKGYANTSVDEVAARAGVSKATIYAHFASKDALFGAIICRRCDDQAEGLSNLSLPEGQDARTILTAIGLRLMALFLSPEVMGIYRMVIAEAPRHPELAQTWYEAGPLRGKQRVGEVFERMKAQGLLAYDAPTIRVVDMFISALRGECFHRDLINLPANPTFTVESTVTMAVDTIMQAYGR